jgi:hypothetical protein
MSSHGRRRPGPEPAGAAQVGWALLMIAAALIGGLAAAALVHTSLTVAVIVSVVAGGIAVLAAFRSPARPPELMAGETEDEDSGRYPAARRRQAPPAAQVPEAAPAAQGLQAVPAASFAFSAPDPVAADPVAADPVAADPAAADPVVPDPVAPIPAAVDPVAPIPAAVDPVAPIPAASDGRARGGPPANEAVVQLLPLPPQPGNAEPADAPWWDSAQLGPPPPSPGAKRSPAPDLSTYLASTFIAQCPRCGAFRFDFRRARSGWDFRCEACEYTWTWQPGTPWPPVRVMPRARRE